MSYEKAMKHHRNPRKGKPQYMGFDTGHRFNETPEQRELICALREVGDWFRSRNDGMTSAERQHSRECVREAMVRLRKLLGRPSKLVYMTDEPQAGDIALYHGDNGNQEFYDSVDRSAMLLRNKQEQHWQVWLNGCPVVDKDTGGVVNHPSLSKALRLLNRHADGHYCINNRKSWVTVGKDERETFKLMPMTDQAQLDLSL